MAVAQQPRVPCSPRAREKTKIRIRVARKAQHAGSVAFSPTRACQPCRAITTQRRARRRRAFAVAPLQRKRAAKGTHEPMRTRRVMRRQAQHVVVRSAVARNSARMRRERAKISRERVLRERVTAGRRCRCVVAPPALRARGRRHHVSASLDRGFSVYFSTEAA